MPSRSSAAGTPDRCSPWSKSSMLDDYPAAPRSVEGAEVEPAQAARVGEQVDLGDPAVGDGEAGDADRLSVPTDHEPGRAVDERRPGQRRELREGERLPGHRRRAADLARGARAAVDAEHDVGV